MTDDTEALLTWLRDPYSTVLARAEAAEAERDDLESRLAALLCELTDGRMSGTGYDVPTMVAEVEAAFERAAQSDIQVYAEAAVNARAERDALAARIDKALELHHEYRTPTSGSTDPDAPVSHMTRCNYCHVLWPCPTVRILSAPTEPKGNEG